MGYSQELKSYLPQIKEIFSEIISKYDFKVYLKYDDIVIFESDKCIIKMEIDEYDAIYIYTTLYDPKRKNHKGLTMKEIWERKFKDKIIICTKEKAKYYGKLSSGDEKLSLLYDEFVFLRNCSKYFEGNFDDVEEDVTEIEEPKPTLCKKVKNLFH
ncbi:MAG: hypothetical protein SFU98_09575 [Leptospiraceae bacterium]|nr:hypothetical protein [Leptospiraceae bacterium]